MAKDLRSAIHEIVSPPVGGVLDTDDVVSGVGSHESLSGSSIGRQVVNWMNNRGMFSKTSAPDGGALDYLGGLVTSPEREARLARQSRSRERVLAIGDALRHIGNIVYTTKGAPSQKFSSPVDDEHKRYLQEKGLRDANNIKFMTYQQQLARIDAANKRAALLDAYKRDALGLSKERLEATKSQNSIMNEIRRERNERLNKGLSLQHDRFEHQKTKDKDASSQGWARIGVSKQNAATAARNAATNERKSGGSKIEYTYDADGRITSRVSRPTGDNGGSKKPLPGQSVRKKKKLPGM